MTRIKNIILKEGFRSVVTNGIRSFTVESLASVLSMSKKTIYQYFPNKEILIKKIIDYRMNKLTQEFNEIIIDETNSILQFLKIREHNINFSSKINLKKLIYLKSRYPDVWEIIEKYRIERKRIFVKVFTLAHSQGYLRTHLDPVICASLYINIFNSTFQPEFLNDNNLSISQTVDHLQTILTNGFFNEEAIKLIEDYSKTIAT
tara:strand:- start:3400 stop:4011 length:612 start_codon:yes stop_codon:yes gene_type:complete